MKTILKYLGTAVFAVTALILPSWRIDAQEAGEKGEDPGAREAARRMELQDENGQIPANAWIDAYAEKEAMPFLPEAWSEFATAEQIQAGVKGGNWVSIGPGNIGGRIRSIIIRPPPNSLEGADQRTIWVGGVAGGIWKSTNSGQSWATNTDRLANLAVNCLAIEPGYHAAGHEVLYAGTGEGFGNEDGVAGNGIYKTTDGGTTWVVLPFTHNNPDFARVNRLAVSPSNYQVLLAAVATGKILRSTNGGTTWTTSLVVSGVAMTDVRFKPNGPEGPIPDVPYCQNPDPDVPIINCLSSSYNGHVYYSIDGGATWTTRANNLGLPPPFPKQRVELAYSRSSPYIVYASKAGREGSPAELFRSENGGFCFTRLGQPPTVPPSGLPGASWYNNVLWVDPTDSETVVVGGIYTMRTRDGGAHWEPASHAPIHLDHHMLAEDPEYDGVGNTIVYDVNDGGIHRTIDILATVGPACQYPPCVQWTPLNNGLGVTQFYGAAGHGPSGAIIGGTQDNGTVRFSGADHWETLCSGTYCGGDTAFCAVDQTEQPYFYSEVFGLQIFRNKNDGRGSEWIWGGPAHANGIPAPIECHGIPCADGLAPFVIDPNPDQQERIVAGGKSLWRTTNARTPNAVDVCWAEIKSPLSFLGNISAVAVAEGDSRIIWVGYGSGYVLGPVFYTTNGTLGTCPPSSSPTPSWMSGDRNRILPQNRRCTHITIAHPTQSDPPEVARTVYATFGGFFPSITDIRGNVWKTTDNGETWTDIHGSWPYILPSAPVYSLVISPSNPSFLYVGTEVGVFASADGGIRWSPAFGGSASDVIFSIIASATASDLPIVYVGTGAGVFATADAGATWVPGFGGPANTPARELFWMVSGTNRQLVVATHGRGMFTLSAAE